MPQYRASSRSQHCASPFSTWWPKYSIRLNLSRRHEDWGLPGDSYRQYADSHYLTIWRSIYSRLLFEIIIRFSALMLATILIVRLPRPRSICGRKIKRFTLTIALNAQLFAHVRRHSKWKRQNYDISSLFSCHSRPKCLMLSIIFGILITYWDMSPVGLVMRFVYFGMKSRRISRHMPSATARPGRCDAVDIIEILLYAKDRSTPYLNTEPR